ncbi:MAG: MATE family efflux transporter [Lachnospiraceae bacterium]|nr:MATE family efflux transporter [Lachnospiraceae bacterium]CDA68519.1 mATE efflux family protein [Clostridium sp. CAG:510]
MKDLTTGKPIKIILLFAIPLFIGQLFQLFYSLADTRIVGAILGETSLAAVGATTTLSDFLIGLLNGFTNGCAIIIATYFGSGDRDNMKKAIGGTILSGIVLSVLISAGCLLFLPRILGALNVADFLMAESKAYIGIVLAGLLAATLYNVCAAILRALGDTFTPLLFLILAAVLNVVLDYTLIKYGNMGVAGAALATVIAQAVSAVLCFFYMKVRYPELSLRREDFRFDKIIYKKLIATGSSMGFMVAFVNLGTLALQITINTFNQDIIVAHTAARKATNIFMLPFSVLGTTLATFCGQNLGAGKYSRIKTGLRDTLLLTFIWCAGVALVAYTLSGPLVHMITASDNEVILSTASLYLKVNTSFYFVTAIICLFRNSMQGFGDNKTPVFSSSLELIGKVAISFLLAPAIGYMGIIVAEPIVWFIMVIPLIVNMVRNPILKQQDKETA